jgi:hypothetical protein
MAHGEHAQSGLLATVSQSTSPVSADAANVAAQGGVAILTILSVAYLIRCLVRLIEVSHRSSNDE